MEDSEKVEIVEEKPEESETKPDESEKLMEKPEKPAVASVEKVTSQVSTSESIAEAPKSETDIPEVSESEAKTNSDEENVVKVEEKQVEIKIVEVKETPKDPPIAIEECDTGGDEIPDVLNIPASLQATVEEAEVETEAEAVPESEKSTEEPLMLAELTTFVPEQDQHVASSDNKPDSDVVALDDDDDDVEDAYDTHNIDDSEDQDDEDDEDVEGVSNEALNDEDEEAEEEDDEEYLYGAQESKNDKPPVKSSQEQIEAEEIDDEDDYDEDDDDDRDDEDMIDLKDDSMGAVVIGSSDEDEPPVPKTKETLRPHSFSSQLSSSSQPQSKAILMQSRLQQSAAVPEVGNTEDIELDYDEDDDEDDVDDDDDDEYDDDDLMNAVVTSASKGGLSPPKKRPRSESPVAPIAAEARQREAHQISVLTRRINYGRIAKKKSLNWLYNKKKREAYKSILPKHKPRNHTEAMRSDQSGGLLHLKISSPSVALIGQKAAINPSSSTPIIARLESTPRPGPASRTKQIKHKSREDIGVIELDSSPEKTQDNLIHSRQQQSDDQRKLDFDLKKPSSESSNKSEQDEVESTKMQQTDKVRDSIQKSTEEVEGVKSAQTEDRLKCEQNKENLQSNEALKKDSDDTTAVAMKVETEAKDASALPASTTPQEDMDTSETNESTMKAASVATSSLKVDIKEEKPDTETSTPADVAAASKVTIEDVPEREAIPSPHPVPVSANKRRRSSSAQDKSKTPKIVEPNQDATGGGVDDNNHRPDDDEEEYIHPTKKLREELQTAYPAHDRILNEYIEKTSNDSVDTIQRHIDQMISEIHTINDMIKAKEVEWNNMLHLKKVKEEIYFRLTRRKQCLEIMSTKVGETGVRSAGLDEDYHNILAGNESAIILGGAKNTPAKPNTMQLSSTPIQAAINTLSCNFTTVSSSMSSTTAPTTAQLIIQNRANMKSSDLVKEKANTLRLHRLLVSRNILPKPTNTASPNASITGHNHQQSPSTNGPTSTQPNASNQPILNSYLTSTDSVQQLVDMMNGHHNNHTSGLQNGGNAGSNSSQAAAAAAMVGRQGPFKDVRSIIADFRQQHPEVVPRRGRRNSRPSSNDSSSQGMSNQNQGATTNHNHSVNSFKDVLAPFSKSQGAVRSAGGQQQNPPYPEVTLHPVSTPLNASGGQDQPTGSLLHGILTKFSRPTESANTKSTVNQASANYISNFSPTLARLLTAPERISPSGTATGPNQSHHNSSVGIANSDGGGGGGGHHHSIPNFGVNLSKVVGHNSEITITPVMNSMHQQSILQQQLQQQQLKDVLTRAAAAVNASNSAKDEHFLKLSSFVTPSAPNNDDDAEDSVDRLVIDEGDLMNVGGEEHQKIAPHAIGQEFNENEVPVCQGCKKHEAQFVCAGCGNQWYCSRECQVTAWDDHSEVCTATKQIRNNFNMLKSRDLDKDEEYLIIRRRKKNKFLPQFY